MPKKKLCFKIVAYDSLDHEYGTVTVEGYTFQSVLSQFFGYVSCLMLDEFTLVHRVDLVSAGRHLFVCSDVRCIVNQMNVQIPLIP